MIKSQTHASDPQVHSGILKKDSRIFLAGHQGMVGSAIYRRLQAENYLNIITRSHDELDLVNQAAVGHFYKNEKIDVVILAAAKVGGIHANDIYRAEFIFENLMIQTNVIHEAYRSGVERLLFLGSSCIYPRLADQPIREEALMTGPLEATNPCGELPLLANEACNLGSIRVDAFVRDGRLDEAALDACVDDAVRFLDDVIEGSRYPFPEIETTVRGNRKIGLGLMGFADLLVDLGIPYDDDRAVGLADRVMGRVRQRAELASGRLAEERGVFPNWEGSSVASRGLRLRNATVTSIAPTGTLSILADCSSGIEPYFGLAFVRHVLDGAELPETNRRFEEALRGSGAWSEDLLAEVRARGSARSVPGVPEAVQRLFPVASDLSGERHLAIQEAFQRRVDNAVSKTVNLPAAATPQDVRDIYVSAWRRGDSKRLAREMGRNFQGYPDVYRKLVSDRNREWVRQIVELSATEGNYLVVVGALHLVGEDSVIAMLQDRGGQVRLWRAGR